MLIYHSNKSEYLSVLWKAPTAEADCVELSVLWQLMEVSVKPLTPTWLITPGYPRGSERVREEEVKYLTVPKFIL